MGLLLSRWETRSQLMCVVVSDKCRARNSPRLRSPPKIFVDRHSMFHLLVGGKFESAFPQIEYTHERERNVPVVGTLMLDNTKKLIILRPTKSVNWFYRSKPLKEYLHYKHTNKWTRMIDALLPTYRILTYTNAIARFSHFWWFSHYLCRTRNEKDPIYTQILTCTHTTSDERLHFYCYRRIECANFLAIIIMCLYKQRRGERKRCKKKMLIRNALCSFASESSLDVCMDISWTWSLKVEGVIQIECNQLKLFDSFVWFVCLILFL